MPTSETPQSIHEFFQSLGEGSDAAANCSMHYACSCAIERGLQAARMLMAVQQALNLPASAFAPAPATAPIPAAPDEDLLRELREARQQARALEEQLARATQDNQRLRDHIRLLQRQLDRLHERREMNNVLGRIEGSKSPDAPAPQQPAEPGTPAAPPRRPPSTLAEAIDIESAMPVRDLDRNG